MSDDEASSSETQEIPEAEGHNEAQIYDGNTWAKIDGNSLEEGDDAELPMSPVEAGNGQIFVTIPTLRGNYPNKS